jgi:hypothetical protein
LGVLVAAGAVVAVLGLVLVGAPVALWPVCRAPEDPWSRREYVPLAAGLMLQAGGVAIAAAVA